MDVAEGDEVEDPSEEVMVDDRRLANKELEEEAEDVERGVDELEKLGVRVFEVDITKDGVSESFFPVRNCL